MNWISLGQLNVLPLNDAIWTHIKCRTTWDFGTLPLLVTFWLCFWLATLILCLGAISSHCFLRCQNTKEKNTVWPWCYEPQILGSKNYTYAVSYCAKTKFCYNSHREPVSPVFVCRFEVEQRPEPAVYGAKAEETLHAQINPSGAEFGPFSSSVYSPRTWDEQWLQRRSSSSVFFP